MAVTSAVSLPLPSLHDAWRDARAREALLSSDEATCSFVKRAVGAGEHLLALEVAEAVDVERLDAGFLAAFLQQKARALAALGSPLDAKAALESAPTGGAGDPETFGLLGRVHKDLAALALDREEKRRLLLEARQRYQRGFDRARKLGDREGCEYCCINVASMSALLDDKETMERMAHETRKFAAGDDSFYSLATSAETALLLGEEEEARDLYRRTFEVAEGAGLWGNVASIRRQCGVLALKLHGRRDYFDESFPDRTVAAFAGHMIDVRGRDSPRFPASAEAGVRERIAAWLQAEAVRWSFSSAACGADVIFLEVAQELGIETHVVLPLAEESFLDSSVRCVGRGWVGRYRRVLDRAASKTVLNEQAASDTSGVYDFNSRMIAARAALHANGLGAAKASLVVWDGQPGDGLGGTADAVRAWCRAKLLPYVIHPALPEKDGRVTGVHGDEIAKSVPPFDRIVSALPVGSKSCVCSVLHLYFESYFDLRESEFETFRDAVLGTIARGIAATSYPPVSRSGLGADYLFVFESERSAGIFAREVLRAIAAAVQSAEDLQIEAPRAILHSGPAQMMVNPVLNQYSYEGVTMTRPGRIARHVTPGAIYCTEAFASLAALEAGREMSFDYAGTTKYEGSDQQDRLFRARFVGR